MSCLKSPCVLLRKGQLSLGRSWQTRCEDPGKLLPTTSDQRAKPLDALPFRQVCRSHAVWVWMPSSNYALHQVVSSVSILFPCYVDVNAAWENAGNTAFGYVCPTHAAHWRVRLAANFVTGGIKEQKTWRQLWLTSTERGRPSPTCANADSSANHSSPISWRTRG